MSTLPSPLVAQVPSKILVPTRPNGHIKSSGNYPQIFDLVTLRLLVAAVEEGNLGRAAKRENIAISAMSRRISEFEARCGVRLLLRTKSGVEPTSACESVLSHVRSVMDALCRIHVGLEEVRGGVSGRIRVRAHMSAICGELPARMADFQAQHPGIEIAVEEETSVDILHAVRIGSCDLGLISGTVRDKALCLIPWLEDELVAVLPPGSGLLAKATLSLVDMFDIPFIGMQRGSALLSLCQAEAAALGGTLSVRAHAASFETARNMVRAGLGVSILPARAALPFANAQGYAVRPLTDTWAHWQLSLCVRDMATASLVTRLFIAHLSAEADLRK